MVEKALLEDGRMRLTENMSTALVSYLLEQREVIHLSDREQAMAKDTTVGRNEVLLDCLERRMKGDPDTVLTLLECLRLAQPSFAATFETVKISHTILWMLASPEAAASVINVVKNSQKVTAEFGPVEHDTKYLYRLCTYFKNISTALVVAFPDKDDVSHFQSAITEARKKWSKTLCLFVYSGCGTGFGSVKDGATILPQDHSSRLLTIPDSVCRLPVCSSVPSSSSSSCVVDPHCAAIANSGDDTTPRLVCSTIINGSEQQATQAGAEICLDAILASLHTLTVNQ